MTGDVRRKRGDTQTSEEPDDAIGAELVRIGRSPRTLHGTTVCRIDEDAQVEDILQAVRPETGVEFRNYKAGTLRRRILRRMILKRTDRLLDYAEILRTTPGEAHALHDDLLIGVTSFFRDDPRRLPALLSRRNGD